MKPCTSFLVFLLIAILSITLIPELTESRDVTHINRHSFFSFRHLDEDQGDQNDDNSEKETEQEAYPDFIPDVCNFTTDTATCKQVIESIVGPKPKIKDTDPVMLAYKTVRLAQRMYGEVTIAVKSQIKDEDGNKDSVEVKKALSGCYKMYLDIVHGIRQSMLDLRKRNNLCPASEFTVIAIANPKECENQLIQAGTSGQKLGFYKDYKELVGVAETCKSAIGYFAHSLGMEPCN